MAYGQANTPTTQSNYLGNIVNLPIATDTVIYKGSAVFLKNGICYNGLANGDLFVGIAENTSANGKVMVNTEGIYPFEFASESVDESDIGKTAYIDSTANNQTITVTAVETAGGLNAPVGILVNVVGGFAYVRIRAYELKVEAVASQG